MFTLPLVVTIGNSGWLRLYLACVHTVCAVAVLHAQLAPVFQWSGLIALVSSLVYHLRRDCVMHVRGHASGKFEVWLEGEWRVARLAASSVIWPSCTVLRYAVDSEHKIRQLVVMPDCLPEVEFRRFRVWLRWRGAKHPMDKPSNPDQ
jgi:hypothetical protein